MGTDERNCHNSMSCPQIRVHNRKLFFLFLNQDICCRYSKEPSRWDGSFEHPKHILKPMGKKIIAIFPSSFFASLALWMLKICSSGAISKFLNIDSLIWKLVMSLVHVANRWHWARNPLWPIRLSRVRWRAWPMTGRIRWRCQNIIR